MLMLPSSYNSQKYSNSLIMFYFLLFIVAFPIVILSMSLFVSFVSKLLNRNITSDTTWNSCPFILFWEVAKIWLSSTYSQLNCNVTQSQLPTYKKADVDSQQLHILCGHYILFQVIFSNTLHFQTIHISGLI